MLPLLFNLLHAALELRHSCSQPVENFTSTSFTGTLCDLSDCTEFQADSQISARTAAARSSLAFPLSISGPVLLIVLSETALATPSLSSPPRQTSSIGLANRQHTPQSSDRTWSAPLWLLGSTTVRLGSHFIPLSKIVAFT